MPRPADVRPWPEASLAGPFEIERTPECARVVIDMGRARQDSFQIIFMIVFWLIWTPVTVFVTGLAIRRFSWGLVLWLVFGVVGVVLIPLALLGASGREIIEIDDAETVMTLDVIRTGPYWTRRISIGQLLHLEQKGELLAILVPLLRERGWRFDVRDTRPPPAVSSFRPDSRASEPNHGGLR